MEELVERWAREIIDEPKLFSDDIDGSGVVSTGLCGRVKDFLWRDALSKMGLKYDGNNEIDTKLFHSVVICEIETAELKINTNKRYIWELMADIIYKDCNNVRLINKHMPGDGILTIYPDTTARIYSTNCDEIVFDFSVKLGDKETKQ